MEKWHLACVKIYRKSLYLTGDVNTFASRNDLKKYIEERGGKLAGSVSSKTNYLITNTPDSGTTKNRTAQSLGVSIITEAQFRKMVDKDA